MNRTEKGRGAFLALMGILFMLQVIAAFCFCMKKTGFHYDEYYSYYSSNVTRGLVPTDREWKPGSELADEFCFLPGESLNLGTVVRMQSYDVHPPFYYILLRMACALTPGVFSKWPALGLNLLFFAGSWFLLAGITRRLSGSRTAVFGVCLLYGLNPAVYSGIVLARMYMLLGLLILFVTWLHVRSLESGRRGLSFWLGLAAAVYLGFLTHYYFAVYLFFLAAAMELYLLLERAEKKSWGRKIGDCLLYGAVVVGALGLAVVSYPACLGHIFRGYRGTEAMGAFFDPGNTLGRLRFFVGLLNEYAFGSLLYVFVLLLALLALTVFTLRKTGRLRGSRAVRQAGQGEACREPYPSLWMVSAAVLGYFAVVTKTALLTAEEANRYQLPVYGLILMLAVLALVFLTQKAAGKRQRAAFLFSAAVLLLMAGGQLWGLTHGKVLFLYEGDRENVAFARENAETPVVYFYNPALTWMIWDDSQELMQYREIYFVSLADPAPVQDKTILQAERVLVYAARTDGTREALEKLAEEMHGRLEKKRELLYSDLYEIIRP
ncbi:MAG: hypothetical protein Q4C65_13540 [Eubacteriales bacterium]|nr:hypothetical protein [Eubacteriales bacterium]